MDANAIPTEAFSCLLPSLAEVIAVSRRQDTDAPATAALTPQAKQELLQATNDFKKKLATARKLAETLPGGDVPPEEQDDLIDLLEKLRDRKRAQLLEFSALVDRYKRPLQNKASDSAEDKEMQ